MLYLLDSKEETLKPTISKFVMRDSSRRMLRPVAHPRWMALIVCVLFALGLATPVWAFEEPALTEAVATVYGIERGEQLAVAGPAHFAAVADKTIRQIEAQISITSTLTVGRKTGPLTPEVCGPTIFCVDQITDDMSLESLSLVSTFDPVLPKGLGVPTSRGAGLARLDEILILTP